MLEKWDLQGMAIAPQHPILREHIFSATLARVRTAASCELLGYQEYESV
jgi:hypothetical protein